MTSYDFSHMTAIHMTLPVGTLAPQGQVYALKNWALESSPPQWQCDTSQITPIPQDFPRSKVTHAISRPSQEMPPEGK